MGLLELTPSQELSLLLAAEWLGEKHVHNLNQ